MFGFETSGFTSTGFTVSQGFNPTNHTPQIGGRSNLTTTSITQGITRYIFWGTGDHATQVLEADRQVRVRTAGTVSDLLVRLISNTLTVSISFTLRKNAADTSLALSVSSGTTGIFRDTTNTASLDGGGAANDLAYRATAPSGTGSVGLVTIASNFEHTDTANNKSLLTLYAEPFATTVSATTHYLMTPSDGGGVSDTATNRFIIRVPGGAVAKNLMVNSIANARTTATTYTVRKNSVNGSGTVSLGAGVTGILDDATNTDSFAAGDGYNIQRVTGTSTESLTAFVKIDFEQATASNGYPQHHMLLADRTSRSLNANTTYYAQMAGVYSAIPPTAVTNIPFETIQSMWRIHTLSAHCAANGVTDATTFLMQVNETDTALSLSVAGSATGEFVSASNVVTNTYFANNLINYKMVVGATGTTISNIRLSNVFASGTELGGGQALIEQAAETVAITEEATNKVLGKIRYPDTLGPQLVLNPSVETGTTTPDNWTFNSENPSTGLITWSTAEARTGTKSVRVNMTAQLDPYRFAEFWSDMFPVQPNGRYRAQFYVKGSMTTPQNGSALNIGWYNSSSAFITWSPSALINQTSYADWTLLSVEGTAPATAAYATVSVYVEDTCDLYFDDFSLASPHQELVSITETIIPIVPPSAPPILKQKDETVAITEAANLIRGRIQQLSETVGITEAVSRILGKTVNVNEAIHITENINRLKAMARVVNESVHITEAINRLKAMSVVINETENINEAVNRIKAMAISANEQVNLSETLNRILGKNITVNESVHITEAVNKILGQARVVNETEAITEAVNYLMGKVRVVNEAVNVTEAVNYLKAMTKVVNESENINEAINRIKNINKQIDENVNITEGVLRLLAQTRVVNETEGISEALNTILGKSKVVPNETEAITEALNLVMGKVRVVNESLDITENINRIVGRIRAVNEDIGIGEAYNIARNLVRVQEEQVAVSEALNRISGLNRVINESVDILEAAQRNLSLIRVVDETIHLTEAINHLVGKIRVINESVDITEAVNQVIVTGEAVKKVVNESLDISEAIQVIRGKSVIVNENVDISENVVRLRGLNRVINENVELTETLNRLAHIVRTVNEEVHVTELTQKVQALVRMINETEEITEAVSYIKALTKVVNETISLPESQISAKGRAVVISEVVAITEDIIALVAFQEAPPTQPELSIGMSLGSNAIDRRRRYSKFPTFRKLQYKPVRLYQQPQKSVMQIEDYRNKPQDVIDEKLRRERTEHLDIKRVVIAKLTVRYNIGNVLSAEDLAYKSLVSQLSASRYPHQIESHQTQQEEDKVLSGIPAIRTALAGGSRTIRPKTAQVETKRNDIILIKDVVEAKLKTIYKQAQEVQSAPLTVKYNIAEETTHRSGKILYNHFNTVTSSLSCGYSVLDSQEYQRLLEQREIVSAAMDITQMLVMDDIEEEYDYDDNNYDE